MKEQNIIPPAEKQSLWKGYLEKFKDPIILILLVAFMLSLALAIYEQSQGAGNVVLLEPLGVLFALLLATGIGFWFEVKADREFDVLNKVNDTVPVKVFREHWCEIPKCDVEAGDLVKLESGDEVPADGTLEEALALRVDESAFTGEPYTQKTTEQELFQQNATYPSNFLLRGSVVLEGTALLRITAIGLDTEEGRGVMKTREGKDVETPLNKQLNRLGAGISKASFILAALILVGRLLVYFVWNQGLEQSSIHTLSYLLNSVMLAMTLIVVAVPEGLPMSITVSLALSMRKMLKENNLVRKLHACETMGAATVICTDKTGTLTQNRMKVVEQEFYVQDQQLILESMAVNSTAELIDNQKVLGNPTEGALLQYLQTLGADYAKLRSSAHIVERKPFSTEYKYMETAVQTSVGVRCYYKGAPERVLEMSRKVAGNVSRESILQRLSEYQKRGFRTLGFAVDDTFIGIVGIADPLREDVKEAIRICKEDAHVRVIIVTGDSPLTAAEIGRQLGLVQALEQSITGPEFAALSDEEAMQLVTNPAFCLISRARPADKARLVTLLQKAGEVVAVTGDGTNDAPALSKAQVGLSMGDGTARAKEASDITILDNSFSSINKAILFGRSLYQNIRRFIVFQMTINCCACLMVLIGAFLGQESPLTVTQMLWVNLIMDTFAAMALSSLPADERVMKAYPRKQESPIIDKSMFRYILGFGLLFTIILLAIWLETDRESLHAHSWFFTWFVMLQFFNLFNVRYLHTDGCLITDIFKGRLNTRFSSGFWLIAVVILLGQVLIVNFGGELFTVKPLSLSNWLVITGGAALIWVIPEIIRLIGSRRDI